LESIISWLWESLINLRWRNTCSICKNLRNCWELWLDLSRPIRAGQLQLASRTLGILLCWLVLLLKSTLGTTRLVWVSFQKYLWKVCQYIRSRLARYWVCSWPQVTLTLCWSSTSSQLG
jgi:hypothetical protein